MPWLKIYSTNSKWGIAAEENFLGLKICILDSLPYSTLSQEKWSAVSWFADGISIIIKKAEKGSCCCVE